jgi:hypothetical protein
MKICPECKYERTGKDDLLFPDYECPSCGIIYEKDKARQELAELEKKREKERKAKLDKLKKEEEERLKKEEQDRKEKEEIERLQKLEADKVRQEDEQRKRQEEEEQLQKVAEEKERQELEEKNKRAKEEENLLRQRQEKIAHMAKESPDKVISPAETENEYQLFNMCPFNMAQTGRGLSIVGFSESKNKWQHARCMQKYCRLWTWKIDENGAVYGQGCSLQFLGLSKEEIERNFSHKNVQILEAEFPLPAENNSPSDQD